MPRPDGHAREDELPGELPAGPEVEPVVEAADQRRQRRPADERDDLRGAGRVRGGPDPERRVGQPMSPSDVITNAAATAIPPPRGIGAVLTRRSPGWSRTSNAAARCRRTSGSERRARQDRGAGEGAEGRDARRPRSRGSRLGQPGNGEAPADVANLGARPSACSAGSSREVSDVHDQPADLAHLGRRRTRASSSAGVPIRMPDAMLGGFGSNGMAFLLTVIPTLVEEALRLPAGHPERRHVDAHQVVVGAARPRARPPAAAISAARTRAFSHRATLVLPELGRWRRAGAPRPSRR